MCVCVCVFPSPAWGLHWYTTHTYTTLRYINRNQPTPYGEWGWRVGRKRRRKWSGWSMNEYKSLPLFSLVVAVVCCLVFLPLWVNYHAVHLRKKQNHFLLVSWFHQLSLYACIYTHTSFSTEYIIMLRYDIGSTDTFRNLCGFRCFLLKHLVLWHMW